MAVLVFNAIAALVGFAFLGLGASEDKDAYMITANIWFAASFVISGLASTRS